MDKKSVIRLAVAILAAVKLILSQFGIEISDDIINSITDLVAATYVVYTAWKNQYVGKKGRKQKETLQKENLL